LGYRIGSRWGDIGELAGAYGGVFLVFGGPWLPIRAISLYHETLIRLSNDDRLVAKARGLDYNAFEELIRRGHSPGQLKQSVFGGLRSENLHSRMRAQHIVEKWYPRANELLRQRDWDALFGVADLQISDLDD